MRLKLKVIPKPEKGSRSVLVAENGADNLLFFKGQAGDIHYECGNCNRVLVSGVYSAQVQNIVMKCPECGAFNETIEG
jgi:transposase-like protein